MDADRRMTLDDDVVATRLAEVRANIAASGKRDVRIVAVTKGFDRSAIECAQRVGLTDIGENYAQEVEEKASAVTAGTDVHFIGRIQRNKVRKIIDHIDLWHSVARPEILAELKKRAERPRVLIQVRPLEDPTKDGVRPDELESMLDAAASLGVNVEGLMTIGIYGDAEATKECFVELARLADQFGLSERSMGMSGDYRDALEAGATMLRLGSVLFGPRPT
jgi:pyridoxal phosphate enzyme (YggS family)